MKKLIYKIYAVLFNISAALFGIKENRAAFVSMHNENFNDSLGAVYEQMKKDGGFEFVLITRQDLEIRLKNIPRVLSFFFVKSRLLATSKYVFLNDNFLPMSGCNFKKEAVITQLWHGEGAFKKFGMAIEQPAEVRRNEEKSNRKLTYAVCTSRAVAPIYAEAFGIPEERVLPLGSARTDYFFREENRARARERFYKLYPELSGRLLVLYAPTFRSESSENEQLLMRLDPKQFKKIAGNDAALLVRLHPQIHPEKRNAEGAVDVTDYDDVRELVLVCDVLITDYSSICMDFALLGKKTVFYAFDLEKYRAERDFYFDYETYVPGRVAKTPEEAALAVKAPFDRAKNDAFVRFNFDFADGKSAERILGAVLEK